MNDITEVDRLNAEIADLKRTIEWYQGRTGIMMGAAAGAALAAVPASEPQQEREAALADRDEVPYLIVFDDHDRQNELVYGGTRARYRFKEISASWNAHLFVKIAGNNRDDKTLCYAAARAPMVPSSMRVPDAAPAPVSGMPDLAARLNEIDRHLAKCRFTERHAARQLVYSMLHDVCGSPSPQAPDTSVAPAKGPLTRCAASRDGDCTHSECPQLRDNEPHATGRHCPLDTELEDEQ